MTRPWTLLAVPGLGLGEESWAPTLTALPDGDPAAVRSLPGYGEAGSLGRPVEPRRLGADLWAKAPEGRVLVLAHSASCQVAARWVADVRHESPRQVPLLVRQYRRTTLRTMAVAMDAAPRDPIVHPLTQATPVPVLVVRGRHDRICPEDWARRVAACGSPGSRAVTLPAGAHMVPLPHGPLVAAEIARFLGDVVDRVGD